MWWSRSRPLQWASGEVSGPRGAQALLFAVVPRRLRNHHAEGGGVLSPPRRRYISKWESCHHRPVTAVAVPLRPPARLRRLGHAQCYLARARSVAPVSAAWACITAVRCLANRSSVLSCVCNLSPPLHRGRIIPALRHFTGTQSQPTRSHAAEGGGFKVLGREGHTSWPPGRSPTQINLVMNLVNPQTKTIQLLAVDHSARASMKNAASCEN